MLESKPLWEPAPVHQSPERGWGSHQDFRFSQSRISLIDCFVQLFGVGRRGSEKGEVS